MPKQKTGRTMTPREIVLDSEKHAINQVTADQFGKKSKDERLIELLDERYQIQQPPKKSK